MTDGNTSSIWRSKLGRLTMAGALTLPIGGDSMLPPSPPPVTSADVDAQLPHTLSHEQYEGLILNAIQEMKASSNSMVQHFGLLDGLSTKEITIALTPSHGEKPAELKVKKGAAMIASLPWTAQLLDLAVTKNRMIEGHTTPISVKQLFSDVARHFNAADMLLPQSIVDSKEQLLKTLPATIRDAQDMLAKSAGQAFNVPLLSVGTHKIGPLTANISFLITDPREQQVTTAMNR